MRGAEPHQSALRCSSSWSTQSTRRTAAATATATVPPDDEDDFFKPFFGRDYKSIASGITDCAIPFDDLLQKSSECLANPRPAIGRCETTSITEFPEIVEVFIGAPTDIHEICSGVLIAEDWVLTSAHCIIQRDSTYEVTHQAGQDLVREGSKLAYKDDKNHSLVAIKVEALNAITLSSSEVVKEPTKAVVYSKYKGYKNSASGADENFYDVALLKLNTVFPKLAIEPATISTAKEIASRITIAGYGYSDAQDGGLNITHVTWVSTKHLVGGGGNFKFKDSPDGVAGFCQGDSGGPAYAELYRGCESERRSRLIQGIIAANDAKVRNVAATDISGNATACKKAKEMEIQDVTSDDIKKWICVVTSNKAYRCN